MPNGRTEVSMKQKLFILKNKFQPYVTRLKIQFSDSLHQGISGLGVVEVILILVVIIGLILIFKAQLTTILNTLFKSIKTDINSI